MLFNFKFHYNALRESTYSFWGEMWFCSLIFSNVKTNINNCKKLCKCLLISKLHYQVNALTSECLPVDFNWSSCSIIAFSLFSLIWVPAAWQRLINYRVIAFKKKIILPAQLSKGVGGNQLCRILTNSN